MKALAIVLLPLVGCAEHVPAGAEPPAPPLLYVSLPAQNAVARIDPQTFRIASTTVVGALPHDFVASRDGRRLWVSLVGSQAVAELDPETGALVRTLRTEPVPATRADGSVIAEHARDDAFGASTCFACHHAGGATPMVVGSRPFGMALSADESTLYVGNLTSGDLSVIDLASGAALVVPLAPSGDAHQPAGLARLGDDLYVTLTPTLPSKSPAVVRRLDGRTLATLGEATTRPASNVIVADPSHDRLYVSNSDGDTIARFDHRLAPIDPLIAPAGPLGLSLAGGRLWIAGYYGNAIAAIDLDGAAPPPSAAPAIVNPTHLALAPDGTALWVVSSGTAGSLVELDPATGAQRRAVPLGALPFDVITMPSSTDKE